MFGITSHPKVIIGDTSRIHSPTKCRMALMTLPEKQFDVVVGDVFNDVIVPYHLLTREYVALIKSRLTDKGMYVLNVVDVPTDPLLLKSMYKTLKAEFLHVDLWIEAKQLNVKRYTYVISARNNAPMPESIQSRKGFKRSWLNITNKVISSGTQMADIPLLSDDYAPVERLSADLVLKEHGI